ANPPEARAWLCAAEAWPAPRLSSRSLEYACALLARGICATSASSRRGDEVPPTELDESFAARRTEGCLFSAAGDFEIVGADFCEAGQRKTPAWNPPIRTTPTLAASTA